jgi:hypothetical protein
MWKESTVPWGISRRVKDQSHKDEMSKALRGDFERLRERGVATTLAPRDEPVPEAADAAEPDHAEPEAVTETYAVADELGDAGRPGWLDRLLGR